MRCFRRKHIFLSLFIGFTSLFYLFRRLGYISLVASKATSTTLIDGPPFNSTRFQPGILKPPGSTYSRILVMGRLSSENVSWIDEELPGLPTAIYTVDDNSTDHPSTIPANKGHEAMAYLTYIIDHYPHFPDVVLFFHAHRTAWHNNIIHDISTPTTIKRLLDEHVVRQGYFNSRCHLDPGCPDWLHVDQKWLLYNWRRKPEEPFLTSRIFHEMHGDDVPVPATGISQPCCAQFAVSGQRIVERKLEEYVKMREWLVLTDLEDKTSGRLMEYSWQWIFGGMWEYCPSMHVCYCEGYGVCFEDGEEGLENWMRVLRKKEKIDLKRVKLWDKGRTDNEKYRSLTRQSEEFGVELERLKGAAMERGKDDRVRAEVGGRLHRGEGSDAFAGMSWSVE